MTALADLLDRQTHAFLSLWERRARGLLGDAPSVSALRPHAAERVRALVAALRAGSSPSPAADAPGPGAVAAPPGGSREHLAALLHASVLDLAEETDTALTARDVRILTSFFASTGNAESALQVEELRASEALLRTVIDALPVLVSYVTADERYGLVNTAYEEWFGVPARSLLGKTLLEVIGDAAYAALGPYVARGLAGERFSFEQFGVPYRLGGNRDVRVEFVPHRTPAGEPDGYIALLQDVTQERALAAEREALLAAERIARAEAQAERDKQHDLFMQAPVAIAIMEGPDHVFAFANPAYRALVGGRDVVGKPLREALPDVSGLGFDRLLDQVLRTGETYVGDEVPLHLEHHRPGEALVLNFVYTPKRDATGRVDGVLVSGWNVTEQVQARHRVEALAEELRQSEERLRRVVESARAGVWELDVASGVIEGNAEMAALLGVSPDRPLTLATAIATVHPDDRERVRGSIRAALAGADGGTFQAEMRAAGHEGSPTRWLESRAQVMFGPDGKATRMAGALLDITPRKAAEAERERARAVEASLRRAAEEANRAKDEFLAMLGHEMRNPLAPITTALRLMRMRSATTFAKERDIIERQVDHLTRLVDDLLDVSRITSGKIELDRVRVHLADVVARAVEMASPLLEQRGHHLEVAVPADGLVVDVDPLRMAQVVANLLTNAAKYTGAGGHITVTAERDGDDVTLRVRDDGVGIAPEMVPRVFEMFAQERQSLERAEGGLGLGLAIVRSVVAMHGGSVGVESAGRGHGSTFSIRLPAAADDTPSVRAARPEAPRPAEHAASRRVLVVDDNVDAAELLGEMLRHLGHAVWLAHDGPSALQVAENAAPDVALLDIGLPVMDGYELAERLRALPGLDRTRLVAVTGYGQASDRRRSAEAGFHGHVVKPLQLEQLEAILAAGGAPPPPSGQPQSRET